MLLNNDSQDHSSLFALENLRLYFFALFIITILFIPFFNKSENILYDDAAYEFFPRQIAIARSIQNFEIPLWDSNRFLGGCPLYTDYETGTYSFLLFPFAFMADLNDLENSFFYLYKLPFFIFTFLAWVCFFWFLKSGFNMPTSGSFIGGLFWAIGPQMLSDAYLYTSDLLVFVFFPLALLGIKKCFDKASFKKFFMAGIFQALMVSGGDLNYIFRCYIFIFSFILILLIQKHGVSFFLTKSFYYSFFLLFSIPFIISSILMLPCLVGIGEGVSWMFSNTIGSMHISPGNNFEINISYVANFLFPNFFGNAGGKQLWGDGLLQFQEFGVCGVMTGGGVLCFFLFNFFYRKNRSSSSVCKESYSDKDTLFSKCFSMGIYFQVITVFLILALYTPAYNVLKIIAPYVFSLPYPVYYSFGQSFGMALCLGAAVPFFLSENIGLAKSLKCYLLFLIIFLIIILSIKIPLIRFHDFFKDYLCVTNLFSLLHSNDLLGWFLKAGFLWIFLFSLILFFAIKKSGKLFKEIKFFLTGLLIFELFLHSYFIFYVNCDNHLNDKIQDKVYKKRFKGPDDHPLYKRAHYVSGSDKDYENEDSKNKDHGQRFLSFLSFADNYSWIFNEFSVFGNDSKPINPIIFRLLSSFSSGFPYELALRAYSFPLISNLGVSSFIAPKGLIQTFNTENFVSSETDDFIKNKARLVLSLEKTIFDARLEKFNILKQPLKFFSFSNKLKYANKESQFANLYNINLKYVTFLDKKKGALIDKFSCKNRKCDFNKPYEALITNLSITPNTIDLKVNAEDNCMLVINQCWHRGWTALVNNRIRTVEKVNWYMQAIEMDKGLNNVKMTFCPETLRVSSKISLVFFFLCLGIIRFKSR